MYDPREKNSDTFDSSYYHPGDSAYPKVSIDNWQKVISSAMRASNSNFRDDAIRLVLDLNRCCDAIRSPDSQTIRIYWELSKFYSKIDEIDDAVSCLVRATKAFNAAGISGTSLEFRVVNDLADLYFRAGRYEEALPHFESLISTSRAHKTHPCIVLRNLCSLAVCQHMVKDFTNLQSSLVDIEALSISITDKYHNNVAPMLERASKQLLDEDHTEGAIAFYELTLRVINSGHKANLPLSLKVLDGLSSAYLSFGRPDVANQLCEDALALCHENWPIMTESEFGFKVRLAQILTAQGQFVIADRSFGQLCEDLKGRLKHAPNQLKAQAYLQHAAVLIARYDLKGAYAATVEARKLIGPAKSLLSVSSLLQLSRIFETMWDLHNLNYAYFAADQESGDSHPALESKTDTTEMFNKPRLELIDRHLNEALSDAQTLPSTEHRLATSIAIELAIAQNYITMNKVAPAFANLKRVEDSLEHFAPEELPLERLCYRRLYCNALINRGDYEEARTLLKDAISQPPCYESYQITVERARIMTSIALTYLPKAISWEDSIYIEEDDIHRHDPFQAMDYLKDALAEFRRNGEDREATISEAYALVRLIEILGNWGTSEEELEELTGKALSMQEELWRNCIDFDFVGEAGNFAERNP